MVRCKGLCARCYSADRSDLARAPRPPAGVDFRALERAWDVHQLAVALQCHVPYPARNLGGQWVARAACRDQRHLAWDGKTVTDPMRAVCDSCPVRADCLAEAMADPAVAGVWAGTTAAERAGLRP